MTRDAPSELAQSNTSLQEFDSSMSEEEKSKCLDEWCVTESKPWIVGTSALLLGLDYPSIRHVIFYNGFYSNLDLVQGITQIVLGLYLLFKVVAGL
jgi:superfamily II DNA helicase RecQ